MNTFVHFMLCQSCRSLRNVSLCRPNWSKGRITVGCICWRHQWASF